MGIPTCRFTDRQHEQFVCSICLDVAQDPVATNNCDHIFCRGCMYSHNSPKCATCQQKLLQAQIHAVEGVNQADLHGPQGEVSEHDVYTATRCRKLR